MTITLWNEFYPGDMGMTGNRQGELQRPLVLMAEQKPGIGARIKALWRRGQRKPLGLSDGGLTAIPVRAHDSRSPHRTRRTV